MIQNISSPRTRMRIEAEALSRSDPAPQPGARECRRSTRGGSPRAEQRSRVCTVHSATYSTDCEQGEKGLPPFDERRLGRRRRERAAITWVAPVSPKPKKLDRPQPQGWAMALPTTESPEGNQSPEMEGETLGSRLRLSAVKLP